LLQTCPVPLRNWEWHYLDRLCRAERLILRGHKGEALAVAYSPDRRRLASASRDWQVRVWDAATGQLLATLDGHRHTVSALAFSSDGQRLAAAKGASVLVWNAGSTPKP
jgi:WD40 repeat protein